MIDKKTLKEIPGFPRYFVSPDLKVWSANGRSAKFQLREIKGFIDYYGKRRFKLSKNKQLLYSTIIQMTYPVKFWENNNG